MASIATSGVALVGNGSIPSRKTGCDMKCRARPYLPLIESRRLTMDIRMLFQVSRSMGPMSRDTRRLPIILAALLASACTQAAPKCADEQAVNTALEIAREKLAETVDPDAFKKISLRLVNIRTTAMDERLGKYTCAADLEAVGPAGSKQIPIRYTSELADGGKRFYITVYGL